MSIWGKILGGMSGFALGGPLGAIIGAVAGHAVDKMHAATREDESGDGTKQIAFTIGVIVLSAKMAKADGIVTREEIDAFKQVFKIPPAEMKNVGRVFNQARKDAGGFEPYARQLGRMFHGNPAVLEELLYGMFHIARADGKVTEEEIEYLESVAEHFGIGTAAWDRIRAANLGPAEADPYHILGVTPDHGDEAVKAAHRKLVLENHPDKLVAQGMPPEFIEIANEKLATVNAAYDEIRKRRGMT